MSRQTKTTLKGNNMPDNQDNDNQNSSNETVDSEDKPMSSKQFNQALSAREKAFEKRLAKQQEDFTKLLERLAPPPKEEPALSRTSELERTVKDLSKQLQERDTREKASNLRKVAEQSLRSHGIDAEFTEHALAYLVDAKQAIKYDEDGNVIMVLNGMPYDSIDEGMAVWAQSRDAKLYKKPTGAAGSGDGNRRGASTLDQMQKSGQLSLKHREDSDKSFNAQDPKLTLERSSKVALSQLLAQKLSKI
jgi:hypothetical protein